ncbi:MAG: flavodoxin family protein [Peptococcaceae bacterium]|nr:flavodoxin family protein [Peptococcaceae bacterium]
MKVVAFNGSPKPEGNTARSIRIVFGELEKEGIETEFVQLGGKKVFGCLACMKCRENGDNRCVRTDDEMNTYIEKIIEADGIIIGSPTYFSNVSSEVKALIDRSGFAARSLLKGKVGVPVVAARRAGSNFVYSAINFYFGISEMIIPGANYWNLALGNIDEDQEGIKTFQTLGKNMAWLLKKINN